MGTLCGYGSCYIVYVNDTIIHYIPEGAQSAFGQSTSCPTQRLTTLWLNPILQAFFIQPLLYFAAFVQVDDTDTSHLWTNQCASTFQQLEIHRRETWRYFRDTQTSLPNFIGCEVTDWWYTDAKRQDCCIR